ncbi:MAG: DNA polymerase III subunit epsilon [Pelagibacteraceae bacterium TMED65]|nr:DNA polymerase III subunit epsilon [Rickettsiales bacterium]OUU51557.1 MAG: DNA polymerase III subunit epsilon [Pelagibacteraceae bacterium TMED65]|tara:strand:+ start:6820 stop:7485 length:666 start_codon:yes stop_codon:yes gene_type:complete
MRQIILDTETSGLDFEKDRIIEVGCIELINGVFTGKKFHKYYKPENIIISQESEQIHGLNNSLLSRFPTFDDSVEELLDFIHQSQLIIHNVQFDLTMINQSLKRKSLKELDRNNTLCTLELAKKKFPGSKNNLNALCRRFDINLDSREKHGALIDSFLLLEVYNELLGGKQKNLDLTIGFSKSEKKMHRIDHTDLPHVMVTSEETKEHRKMLEKMKNNNWS